MATTPQCDNPTACSVERVRCVEFIENMAQRDIVRNLDSGLAMRIDRGASHPDQLALTRQRKRGSRIDPGQARRATLALNSGE